MPDSDVAILARMTSASWEHRPFANVALDECMEMFNRVIKQALHRIPPGCIKKVAAIVEHRKIARDEVERRFYKQTQARNTVSTLVSDRQEGARKTIPFLTECDAFEKIM